MRTGAALGGGLGEADPATNANRGEAKVSSGEFGPPTSPGLQSPLGSAQQIAKMSTSASSAKGRPTERPTLVVFLSSLWAGTLTGSRWEGEA
jgi:hypothetical protein